ncbi:MAG: transcription elongation factor GreA [Anaerolineaceae bacterium]|jgi:transcription elongation factor GreA
MTSEVHYLTREGAEKLKTELEELKGPARLELSKRLRSAIQQGDLSENADYSKAKEDQSFLEGRILELESILNNAKLIDDLEISTDYVGVGNRVTIQEEDFPEETYFVVGPKEADPVNGRISHESPIGKALLGHKIGETVAVSTPGGEIYFRILKIE